MEQPIKNAILQQVSLPNPLDIPTATNPQLSQILESKNALVGGGIGTFTNLMDYQKAAANDTAMINLTNVTGETISPNSTSCTSGLADLSWASNDSAVSF
jgi:hypothetical protein